MWQHYLNNKNPHNHSVVGNVRIFRDFYSPQLNNQRDILAYLPPSYDDGNKRYPVIYMHDGQNLFDRATSYSGEWGVDETMESLAEDGYEAIIVGIPHIGAERINEYSPFDDPRFGKGKGEAYMQFILETLKPLVDRDFRTLTGKDDTGLLGSSMGGLITLYGFFRFADHFGFAGIMSPSLWFNRGAIVPVVVDVPFVHGRLYLDMGTNERLGWMDHIKQQTSRGVYSAGIKSMRDILEAKGYQTGYNLKFVEEKGGAHNEASWGRRLPSALRFLLNRR